MGIYKNYKNNKGFSLLEILLAAVILVIGALGAMKIFIPMFESIEADRERIAMTNIALDRIEEWRANTYSELVPEMSFTYFTRAVNSDDGSIAFGQRTIMINSISKIDLTADAQNFSPGYNYNFNLPSAANMLGGVDVINDVWYDGPNSTPGNNTPGVIELDLTCPKGVSGILTITVHDYDNKQREEKVYINGIVVAAYNNGDTSTSNDFITPQIVRYTLTQTDTQTGQIFVEIKQTADSNLPTYAGGNPNAVVSSVDFSILEGFQEHDSAYPYVVESTIASTYDVGRLVPGWEIIVTVSRSDSSSGTKSVSLATTISK